MPRALVQMTHDGVTEGDVDIIRLVVHVQTGQMVIVRARRMSDGTEQLRTLTPNGDIGTADRVLRFGHLGCRLLFNRSR
jgi:hypothetical protein